MPKEFEDCVKNGGKVRTVSGPDNRYNLDENQFVRLCKLGEQLYVGEIKTKKAKSK